jgi:hypothetical protein
VLFFKKHGDYWEWLAMTALSVIMISVYIVLIRKFGKRLFERLFVYENRKEWILYALSAFIYFIIVEFSSELIETHLALCFIIFFIVWWGIVILCFAINNTHEKTKQKYEADFSRDIIASGRDHYQQMNEQFNALRILKHDYKFHLNTALNMLRKGEIEKSDEYLRGLQTVLQEEDILFYCDNPVINSLIADYARR